MEAGRRGGRRHRKTAKAVEKSVDLTCEGLRVVNDFRVVTFATKAHGASGFSVAPTKILQR